MPHIAAPKAGITDASFIVTSLMEDNEGYTNKDMQSYLPYDKPWRIQAGAH